MVRAASLRPATRRSTAGHAPVFTESPKVRNLRRNIVELVLTDHPLDCLTCEVNGNCELQTVAAKVGVRKVRYPAGANHLERTKDLSHPYLTSDLSKCINCSRCVRACDEVQGQHVLSMHGRGFAARIIKGLDQSFMDSTCVSCGACSQACPTSAISDVFQSKSIEATKKTRTVCTYCGVGCNLNVATKGREVLSIQAPADSEVNHSHTCLKGRYAFRFVNHPDRLRTPLIRYNGHFTEATWDEAYDYIVKNLTRIKEEHGGDAVAGISSARCTNEENYLMQKFIRAGFGTNNIDACARVCHSPTAWGMQKAFGTGAATNSIADLEFTNCILITGANPTEGHPVTGSRIKQRVLKGVPLIVIDPREIELVPYAKHHFLQLRPGTNVALLDMFAFYLLDEDLIDRDFITKRCENWDEFEKGLRSLNLDELEAIHGVPREQVRAAAIEYGKADNAMAFHGLGVTEHSHGSKTVMTLADIAMMTGNIGRPGVGVLPLRGQNNVQGAADMGCQPHQGAGYLQVNDPEMHKRYEEFYGVHLSDQIGYKIPQMYDAALAGHLKALWIMGEDVAQTDPNTEHVTGRAERPRLPRRAGALHDAHLRVRRRRPARLLLPREERHLHQRRAPRPARQCRNSPGRRHQTRRRHHRRDHAAHGDGPARLHPRGRPRRDRADRALLQRRDLGEPHRTGHPVAHRRRRCRHAHPPPRQLQARPRQVPLLRVPRVEGDRKHGAEYPFILTTGRILEHYNCGTMTRRTGNARSSAKTSSRSIPMMRRRRASTTGTGADLFGARRGADQGPHLDRGEARDSLHDLPLSRASREHGHELGVR
jgi:formate dehydrogenase major subunit